ncbi:hypothetical protein CDAR_317871 [Caerostris darwini]|uniref:Uncharacterized protein n=1 Tax=Caerostris darwini TaxID=1538125 RepID=A0AAV4WS53_9ARAC|nr:hypothetical protein CDAR_317871 [Caerostris darwini]
MLPYGELKSASIRDTIGTGEPELVTKGASEEGIFLHRKFRGWLGLARPTDSAKSVSPRAACHLYPGLDRCPPPPPSVQAPKVIVVDTQNEMNKDLVWFEDLSHCRNEWLIGVPWLRPTAVNDPLGPVESVVDIDLN